MNHEHHNLMTQLGFSVVETTDHGRIEWFGHGVMLEFDVITAHEVTAAQVIAAATAQARCDAVAGHQQHLRRALGFDLAGNGFVMRTRPPEIRDSNKRDSTHSNPVFATETPSAATDAP